MMIENVREILKLKYDDYYKFLVSLGLIIFVISAGLLYYLSSKQVLTWFVSIWLTIFLVIAIISFFMGIIGWKERQDNLDRLLRLEVSEKEIAVKKLELDLLNAKTEQKKSEARLSRKGLILNKLPMELK